MLDSRASRPWKRSHESRCCRSSARPGVENAKVVDLIGVDPASDKVVLTMIERRPWGASDQQFQQIEEKINRYMGYVLDGFLADHYPQYEGKDVQLLLECAEEPHGDAVLFVQAAARAASDHGLEFVVAVKPPGGLTMNVVLFGATGMVGQGVLLECLDDPGVKRVVSVVRRPTGVTHAEADGDRARTTSSTTRRSSRRCATLDACFFCLGVSSAGMKEEDYRHITYDLTLAAARTLHRLNPKLAFIYVSGAGTDSTEQGRSMWARVKGKTENDLADAVRDRLHVPSRLHPPGEGRHLEDRVGPRRDHGAAAGRRSVLKQFEGVGTQLGRARARDDRRRAQRHALARR